MAKQGNNMTDDENNINDVDYSTDQESETRQDDEIVDSEDGGQEPAAPQLHLVDQRVTPEQVIEAILFSCDNPLAANKIASVMDGVSTKQVRQIVEQLNSKYDQTGSAFRIEELAGGYQMMTRPEYAGYLQQLYKVRSEGRLSTAALETLAVVAYKQPVQRAEIEAIRGVACGEMLRSLMEKGLIKIVGRAEELGRPMLYGTTKRFLQVFGLGTLDDLPKVPELQMPLMEKESKGDDNTPEPSEEPQSARQDDPPPPTASAQPAETDLPPDDA
jgi:segregation and condensation protein B